MTALSPAEEALATLDQKAAEYLALSGNCAQTSFLALQEQFGLDGGPILKALTPFPGIALRGETCGAVIGCLMALGLVHGREKLDDVRGFLVSLRRARKFCQRFEDELGSTMCADIVEAESGKRYDLADRAQAAEWQAGGGLEQCTAVVRKAVRIAADIGLDK